ncbi:E3 ubiquitin-protein ligase TRIM17-like isoform X2 [Scylla paramamosain]|uniref:E3 ubiquitin-protein ligase TRIM17-like isoform X2 n=1 Tax=Scylla paramamosain TaxID=85552 RepID=UPI003082CC9E
MLQRLQSVCHLTTGGRTSMTEGLATPLRSVLTCGGCGRRYDDASHRPKFLSCFHTACLSCLRKDFSGGKVKCPTCACVTEVKSADSLPDNTQLCTILLNMSSLNLHEAGTSTPARDTCPAHAARINFWCDTCRMPLCRDCTVLAHREAHGHKVRDHDQAVAVLRAEVRSSVGEARTLLQETRRLRHDQRKYLLRQLDAARAYEKQLKSELKALDNDKKEDSRGLDRIETDSEQETSLISLQEMAQSGGVCGVPPLPGPRRRQGRAGGLLPLAGQAAPLPGRSGRHRYQVHGQRQRRGLVRGVAGAEQHRGGGGQPLQHAGDTVPGQSGEGLRGSPQPEPGGPLQQPPAGPQRTGGQGGGAEANAQPGGGGAHHPTFAAGVP